MNSILLSNVSIDIHEGSIGVSVSGGADSAILLYVLMKHATGPIHIYTCYCNQKQNGSHVLTSGNVINKCIELTGKTDIHHHTYAVEKKTRETWINGLIPHTKNKTVFMMW